ncbi:MAG: glycosyltransferase family 2 protein, partial [Solirubrobacteraceae bacterium]
MTGPETQPPPRITVIVPCFNDGVLVPETLASLDDQEPLEVLVVDDASTDPETHRVLSEFERDGTRVLRHETNRGLSAARMTGLAQARTRYVFPLDSDDLVAPRALTLLADMLDSRPVVSAAFADYEEFGDVNRTVAVPLRLDPFLIAYRNAYPVSALF